MEWQSKSAIGADLYNVSAARPGFDLGTIVTAEDKDPTTLAGEAEFMLVRGADTFPSDDPTLPGFVVSINPLDWTCAPATANDVGLIGVSLLSFTTNDYMWVQVRGRAVAYVADVAAGRALYLSSSVGRIDDAAVSGDLIYGAFSLSDDGDPAAANAYVALNRPYTLNTAPA